MGVSIRDIRCENCGKIVPHKIFSSLKETIYTCLICNDERIEERNNADLFSIYESDDGVSDT